MPTHIPPIHSSMASPSSSPGVERQQLQQPRIRDQDGEAVNTNSTPPSRGGVLGSFPGRIKRLLPRRDLHVQQQQLPLSDDRVAKPSPSEQPHQRTIGRFRSVIDGLWVVIQGRHPNGHDQRRVLQDHEHGDNGKTQYGNNVNAAGRPLWTKINKLKKAAVHGKWETAKKILDALPGYYQDANYSDIDEQVGQMHYTITTLSIGRGESAIDFVKQLIEHLPTSSLTRTAGAGMSVLHAAAAVGNTAAATLLVKKMPDLVYLANSAGNFPVHVAARLSHREVLRFLMSVTKWDVAKGPLAGAPGQLLLFVLVVEAELFDIALELVHDYPDIAITKLYDKTTALGRLAGMESTFSTRRGFLTNLWECFLCFPQTKSTINGKKHQQALALVIRVCKAMKLSQEEPVDTCGAAILKAAALGNHEVVEIIEKSFPGAIASLEPGTNRNIFHLAIKNRCEQVFNLIYRIRAYRHVILERRDSEGNTVLHFAAKLAPAHKLNQVSGAALQMQREIQWYKEVEKLVSPLCKRGETKEHQTEHEKPKDDGDKPMEAAAAINDHQTPAMIFTKEHEKLKEAGEAWMKATANSCSFVAVLITTIMFAAAITVPGGNEGSTGFPIFGKNHAFLVFAIADAVSLFASATSLLVFLSILTSRFPEDSFLYYHPTQLIVGLGALFLSIASMMVAFAAVVFLVLGRETMWILIPTSALACLGVASFAFLQFPLLVALISSTYGRGIFDKRSEQPLF